MIQHDIEKKILWRHLDPAGIVYYPKYYEWIDGCSHLLFEKISLNLVDLWKERQLQFGLAGSACEYFSPGRYHQEIIISTHIETLEKKTITINHTITNKRDNRIMVKGMEKRICIYEKKPGHLKAIDIPDDIYARLEKAL